MSFTRNGSCYTGIRPSKKLMCYTVFKLNSKLKHLISPDVWGKTKVEKRRSAYALMNTVVSNLHLISLPVMARYMDVIQAKLAEFSKECAWFVRYQYIIDNYRKNGRYLREDMDE